MRMNDLTGRVFGRQKVLRQSDKRNAQRDLMWEIRCSCGDIRLVARSAITRKTKSAKSCKKCAYSAIRTHGFTPKGNHHYLYKLWDRMKSRCYNKNNASFKGYGLRGICVCNQWVDDFSSFKDYILEYLGERPSKGHSLDRINNDGNYEPGNVRWATCTEQCLNTRKTYRIVRISDMGQEKVYPHSGALIQDGFSRGSVRQCLNGHQSRYKGFTWRKEHIYEKRD